MGRRKIMIVLPPEIKCQEHNLENKSMEKNTAGESELSSLPGPSPPPPFNYSSVEWIMKFKWMIIKLDRLERLYSGEWVPATVPKEWLQFPEELKQFCGPLNSEDKSFEDMQLEFKLKQYPEIIEMMEYENTVMNRMMKLDIYPSNPVCSERATLFKQCREKLEEAFKTQLDIVKKTGQCGQLNITTLLFKSPSQLNVDEMCNEIQKYA